MPQNDYQQVSENPDRLNSRRRELSILIAGILAAGATSQFADAREVPFARPPEISSNLSGAYSTHSADIDGDGDPDVVAVGSSLVWFENDGAGEAWSPHTLSTSIQGGTHTHAVDIDADGDTDIVFGSRYDSTVAWFENKGAGQSWSLHTISTVAGGVRSVRGDDVDGDGDMDVLAANGADDEIVWFDNAGGGSGWTVRTIGFGLFPRDVESCDIDGDSDVDAVHASYSDNTVAWHENETGDGQSWTRHLITTSADSAISVNCADVDGDGDRDVLSASFGDGTIAWHENDGTGTNWTFHTVTTIAGEPTSVVASDLDDDGDLDIVATENSAAEVTWYENDSAGANWTRHRFSNVIFGLIAVHSDDLDNDGDNDVLAAAALDDKVVWFRNDTIHRSAAFPAGLSIATLDDARDIATGDITGNGLVDAAAVSFNENTVAWYSNAAASWTPFTVTTTANGASSVELADLDADGDLDIIYTAAQDDAVAWQENDGSPFDGGWAVHTVTTSAESARDAIAVDLDRDGDLDLVSASKVDNKLAWYESDGTPADGGWATHTITTGASGTESVIAADLDGDGDPDLVSVNFFSDSLDWYENDGTPADGGWVTHSLAAGIDEPKSVAAADLDGDGDIDIIGASQAADAIIRYENDGTPADTAWSALTITSAASVAQAVHAADMDADGDVDVVSASSGDSKVAWYENDGTGASWTLHTVSVTAGAVGAVTSADVDGDGDVDPLSAPFGSDSLLWFPNEGGQFALPTLDVAQKVVGDGQLHDLLDITLVHRGRSGDSDVEWTSLDLEFTDGTGSPLSASQQSDLFQSIRVYRDDGSGAFEADTDTQLATGAALCCSGGVRTINFNDDDSDVAVSFGLPRTYFVVAEMTSDATSQSPSNFRVTHLTESTSTGEDAAADTPLTLEFALNKATGVVDTQLDSTTCHAPFDLQLADRTVNDTLTCEAGTLLSAENFDLTGSADVTFRSGEQVTLRPGFSIQAGQFAVVIDPTLKP